MYLIVCLETDRCEFCGPVSPLGKPLYVKHSFLGEEQTFGHL